MAATEPRCPQAHQAVGWAMRALEPEEELEVTQHLPRCAECQALVSQTEELMATLGASGDSVEPPSRLKADLMAKIEQTPQVRRPINEPSAPAQPPPPDPAPVPREAPSSAPREAQAEPVQPVEQTPAEEPKRPRIPVRRASRSPGPWLRRRRVALVAAVLVGVLGIGGLVIRTAQLQQERDLEAARSEQIAQVISELDQPGTTHATLIASNGQTMATLVEFDGQRKLLTSGMPANKADSTIYVLWGTGAAAPQALGTFDVSSADPGLQAVGSPTALQHFSGYAISLEPGRAAPPAPSTVVASGQVVT